jgi:hypothetical protein
LHGVVHVGLAGLAHLVDQAAIGGVDVVETLAAAAGAELRR